MCDEAAVVVTISYLHRAAVFDQSDNNIPSMGSCVSSPIRKRKSWAVIKIAPDSDPVVHWFGK